jgi:drug/metabolite transporter (DMT)-like permease
MITVLLALIFLHERLGRVQWLGLALAFVAIYLLSA